MIQITFRNKKFDVTPNSTARDTLKKLNIDPESVLITVNGKLVTDDLVLREGDTVKLVAVVSGGGNQSFEPICDFADYLLLATCYPVYLPTASS